MDFKDTIKNISFLEWILLLIFAIYVVFPLENPAFVSQMVNNPLSIVFILFITIYLFIYVSPIVSFAYAIVGYFLINRSTVFSPKIEIQKNTPTQAQKNYDLQQMNPVREKTLEETEISRLAPIGQSSVIEYVSTGFKPTFAETNGVSKF